MQYDPDDAPELTEAFFAKAVTMQNGHPVRGAKKHQQTPEEFYLAAAQYLSAVEKLVGSPIQQRPPEGLELPVLALACFSLEFYLKAWVSDAVKRQHPQAAGVRPHGHELLPLYRLAVKCGLPEVSGLTHAVTAFDPDHRDHLFRYFQKDRTYYPKNMDETVLVMRQYLDKRVREKLATPR
ncbi:hypothetical protein [Gluconobacter japonicus]|uniref:HEPN domain-containing protein n=1 Tax=Gluconobacter japonicus TaxID=376620 RepID=A0A9Q2FQR7_GLUJA|nr:hypothetical protein [Gluconobacter japonicus]MBF0871912.1 hypothetical protein [Gluconobacter japonicus]